MTANSAAPEYFRRINAALALREVPDPEAALKQLELAHAAAPSDATVELLLGMTFQDLGDPVQAELHLRQAMSLAPDMPDSRKELGTLLLQQSRFHEAVDVLRSVVEGRNSTSTIVAAYATALRKAGRPEEAIRLLEQSIADVFREHASLWAMCGRFQLEQNRIGDALRTLERAAKLDPTLDVLNDLAGAYALQGRVREAIEILSDLAERFPNSDRVARSLSHCYLRTGNPKAALKAADRSIELNRHHFRNWQARADALIALRQSNEAMRVIEKGIALAREKPDGAPVIERWLQQRVRLTLDTDGSEAALIQIDRDTVDFGPSAKNARLAFSVAFSIGRFERALQSLDDLRSMGALVNPWERIATLDGLNTPELARSVTVSQVKSTGLSDADRDIVRRRGGQLYRLRAYAAAKSLFQQAHELDPNDSKGSNNLAFMLLCEGDWVGAEQILRQVLSAECDFVSMAQTNLGYALLRQGRYPEAIDSFALAYSGALSAGESTSSILHVALWRNGQFSDGEIDRFPSGGGSALVAARANCATALFLDRKVDEAVAMAKLACEADPNSGISHCVLGCVLAEYGATKEARDALAKALALAKSEGEKKRVTDLLSGIPE